MEKIKAPPRHRFIIEGHDCRVMPTEQMCHEFLMDLTGVIEMNLWMGPFTGTVLPGSGKEHGRSAVVMWLESGCQIHSWDESRYVDLNIFSCREFSVVAVQDLFQKYFQPAECRNCVPVTTGWKG